MTPKKILIIVLVILGLGAYIAGSFWVIGMMKQKNMENSTQENTTDLSETVGNNITHVNKEPSPTPPPTATPTPRPTPTPTPQQGPGRYACDQDGVCGDYSDAMRKYCPRTFADRNCLGMCATPGTHCSQ